MKKSMKKFMIACAAVSSIAIAAGMSAMAADYNAENNSVPVTVPEAEGQKTILVVPADPDNPTVAVDPTEDNIYYINQGETLPADALLKADIPDGTYFIKVGYYEDGTFKIATDTFVKGNVGGDVREILMGDVTLDGNADNTDAQQILRYYVKGTAKFATNPDAVLAADVTRDGNADNTDAQQVLRYYVKGTTKTKAGQVLKFDSNNNVVE